jgi:hypothetical protein
MQRFTESCRMKAPPQPEPLDLPDPFEEVRGG